MTSSDSLAIIVITLGALSAITLFIFLLLCCKFTANLRKKQHRTGGLCHRTIIFEQQTTTSDDNNAELFSCCLDESTSMVHPERESDPISSSFATGDFDDDHNHHLKSLGTTVATVTGSTIGQINQSNSIKHQLESNEASLVTSSNAAAVSFTPLATHQPSPVKMPHAINVLYIESSTSVSSTQGDTSEGEASLQSSTQPHPAPVDTIDSGDLLRKMDQMNEMCHKSSIISVSNFIHSNEVVHVKDKLSGSDMQSVNKAVDKQEAAASKNVDVIEALTGDDHEECAQSAGETITSVPAVCDQSSSNPSTPQSTTAITSRLFTKSEKSKRFTRSMSNNAYTSTSGSSPSDTIKCITVAKISSKETGRDASVNTNKSASNAQCDDKFLLIQAQPVTAAHNSVPCPSASNIGLGSKVKLQTSASTVSSSHRAEKSEIDTSATLTSVNIKRQESVDLPDDQVHRSLKAMCLKDSSVESSGSERSPETVRKQYKELWQLRAEFHAEELAKERAKAAQAQASTTAVSTDQQSKSSPSSSSSAGSVALTSSTSIDVARSSIDKLGDSGYKSTEGRKDYSIDSKSETIYLQFTSGEGIGVKAPSAHPSIEEEEEEEEEEVIFV